MNKKTISSIAAAVALGTGVAVYKFSTTDSQPQSNSEIDWSIYELNVPVLEVPVLEVPKLDVPTIDVPKLNVDLGDDLVTTLLPQGVELQIDVPSVSIPIIGQTSSDSSSSSTSIPTIQSIKAPDLTTLIIKIDSLDIKSLNKSEIEEINSIFNVLNVPTIAADIEVPFQTVPKVDIPSTSVYFNVPSQSVPGVDVPNTSVDFNVPTQAVPGVNVPVIEDPAKDFGEWVKMQRIIEQMFIDKRSASHDKTLHFGNKNIKKWIAIYEKYKEVEPVRFIKIDKKFKMISEACIPSTYSELSMLSENLNFYKSEGYDSVLVTFTLNDSLYDVLNTIKYIRQYHSLDVWLAFTGEENLSESVFGDPDRYAEILSACAPYIVGYVNSWRRTSCHIWKQDAAFMNYTNFLLRKANPGIKILGEMYYGNTYKYDTLHNVGFETNIFDNASGIMIVNFGYSNVDFKRLMTKVIAPRIGSFSPVGVVIGTNAYYLGEYPNRLSWQENIAAKHKIEDAFIANGCAGTITLQDDGRGSVNNNLCKTLHSSLSSKLDK